MRLKDGGDTLVAIEQHSHGRQILIVWCPESSGFVRVLENDDDEACETDFD